MWRFVAVLMLAIGSAGCPSQGGQGTDLSIPDLNDGGGDASVAQLDAGDAAVAQLDAAAATPDLTTVDLKSLPDLTPLPDLTALPDLTSLPDLTPVPDLTTLPDLTPVPDLSKPDYAGVTCWCVWVMPNNCACSHDGVNPDFNVSCVCAQGCAQGDPRPGTSCFP